jgi:hypothetical protein
VALQVDLPTETVGGRLAVFATRVSHVGSRIRYARLSVGDAATLVSDIAHSVFIKLWTRDLTRPTGHLRGSDRCHSIDICSQGSRVRKNTDFFSKAPVIF